jgi:hypothetical protein
LTRDLDGPVERCVQSGIVLPADLEERAGADALEDLEKDVTTRRERRP